MKENENERLMLFSDAVIAITITLLVLDMRLPETETKLTDAALWEALVGLTPQLVAYILSFLVIGVFWLGHRSKFEHIVRHSPVLVWINLIFLLEIGLMPFVTGVLAESGGALATMLYAAAVSVISLTAAAMSWYALKAGLTDLSSTRSGTIVWPILAPAAVFLSSIAIAPFSVQLAQLFWLMLIPASILSGRFSRR
jgi:uncharacterized membrane protein